MGLLHPALVGPELVQGAVAQLLAALPRLAVALALPEGRRLAGLRWEAAYNLAAALRSSAFSSALQAQLAADCAANAAALAATCQLMLQLPLEAPPPGIAPAAHATLAAMLAYVAADLCQHSTSHSALWDVAGPHRQRLARQLARVLARLPSMVQLVASSYSGEDPDLAAGTCASLSGLPRQLLESCVPFLAYDARALPPGALVRSLEDAAAWATAAVAGLRCAPLLAAAAREEPQGDSRLAMQSLVAIADCVATAARQYAFVTRNRLEGLPPGGSMAAARAAVWQLHSTACR